MCTPTTSIPTTTSCMQSACVRHPHIGGILNNREVRLVKQLPVDLRRLKVGKDEPLLSFAPANRLVEAGDGELARPLLGVPTLPTKLASLAHPPRANGETDVVFPAGGAVTALAWEQGICRGEMGNRPSLGR